jgi:predicted nuclease of restriction endonuclease-like (RecB) superfamily
MKRNGRRLVQNVDEIVFNKDVTIKQKTMQTDQHYTQLLQDLKFRISQSRYVAARLVNQEQLKLYFNIGKLLDEKITAQKWGDKVLLQIASDLINEIPTLRGFSHRSLKKMRQFYTAYANEPIGPLLTAQLQSSDKQVDIIGQLATGQLQSAAAVEGWSMPTIQIDYSFLSNFFSITFTHLLILLHKCKTLEERMFYMQKAAEDHWSVALAESLFTADR